MLVNYIFLFIHSINSLGIYHVLYPELGLYGFNGGDEIPNLMDIVFSSKRESIINQVNKKRP